MRAPFAKEVRAILEAAADLDPRYGVCVRLIAASGTRRGEVAALRWSDIDWDGGTVTIDEAIVTAEREAVVKSPKTRASIRRLAVDEGTIGALRGLRRAQERLARASGVELPEDGFVFSNEPGGTVPPNPTPSAAPSLQRGRPRRWLTTSTSTRSATSRPRRSTS